MTTLTNSFHNTTSRTRLTRAEMEAVELQAYGGRSEADRRAARRVVRRHWKKLCGITECTCGNAWGER